MDRLWAPWRNKYIRKAKKQKGCVFCRALKNSGADHVVFKTRHSLAILNIYPYNNGHCMVAPVRHVKDFDALREDEVLDLFRALKKIKKLLAKTLKPEGFNIGANIGRAAGAGILGHLHIHIVPRWVGDANFMTVSSGMRVISQSLGELLRQLKNAQSGPD